MDSYDLIIIGAGPAGLTAGLYAGRSRLKTVVLESMMPGGQAAITDLLENYPGVGAVNGAQLAQGMLEQMQEFGAELVSMKEVTGLRAAGHDLFVAAGDEELRGRAVVVATGTAYRRLGVPGELELAGRGVSYCATCDAPFYKGQEVAVVGGGDSALQEALYLTKFVERVYLIHRRDEFRAVKVLGERVLANDKIECLCSTVVTSINGTTGVESLELEDRKTGKRRLLKVPGVFLFVGLEPRTGFLAGTVALDEWGFVKTDDEMKTNVRGVFAAGDCRSKTLRQVSTAVGDGATAAFVAYRFLEDGDW